MAVWIKFYEPKVSIFSAELMTILSKYLVSILCGVFCVLASCKTPSEAQWKKHLGSIQVALRSCIENEKRSLMMDVPSIYAHDSFQETNIYESDKGRGVHVIRFGAWEVEIDEKTGIAIAKYLKVYASAGHMATENLDVVLELGSDIATVKTWKSYGMNGDIIR